MANKLPNELVCEILSVVLDVPDEMFRDVSFVSPFSRPAHLSSSSVLAVCKRWRNVAIPHLYRVVILRSKAQAYAIARVLRQRTEIGTHIKKLRVEGGYGAAMHRIITCAPNITDLCISMDIRSSDSVKGLCSSLSKINPHCLVVLDSRQGRTNAPFTVLVTNLSSCLKTWTNLVSESDVHRLPVLMQLRTKSISVPPTTSLSMI